MFYRQHNKFKQVDSPSNGLQNYLQLQQARLQPNIQQPFALSLIATIQKAQRLNRVACSIKRLGLRRVCCEYKFLITTIACFMARFQSYMFRCHHRNHLKLCMKLSARSCMSSASWFTTRLWQLQPQALRARIDVDARQIAFFFKGRMLVLITSIACD